MSESLQAKHCILRLQMSHSYYPHVLSLLKELHDVYMSLRLMKGWLFCIPLVLWACKLKTIKRESVESVSLSLFFSLSLREALTALFFSPPPPLNTGIELIRCSTALFTGCMFIMYNWVVHACVQLAQWTHYVLCGNSHVSIFYLLTHSCLYVYKWCL